jgi:hypothetical protein
MKPHHPCCRKHSAHVRSYGTHLINQTSFFVQMSRSYAKAVISSLKPVSLISPPPVSHFSFHVYVVICRLFKRLFLRCGVHRLCGQCAYLCVFPGHTLGTSVHIIWSHFRGTIRCTLAVGFPMVLFIHSPWHLLSLFSTTRALARAFDGIFILLHYSLTSARLLPCSLELWYFVSYLSSA